MQKCQGNFSSLVTEANNDAMELLRLIVATFPSFDDSTTFEGKKVFFYKRAQLLVSDICQVFDGKGYGKLKNINELTVCADYKIPEMLRKLGILSYVPELAAKIANKVLIPKDSKEEIEIRANTIWAVEIIKQEIQKKISDIDSMHIGDHIWLASGPIKIYHRTLTTCY